METFIKEGSVAACSISSVEKGIVSESMAYWDKEGNAVSERYCLSVQSESLVIMGGSGGGRF